MDRHTNEDSNDIDVGDNLDLATVEYYESNCAIEPVAVCNFRRVEGRILKTVDSVHANVASGEECRELCINANFR